jgi:hypothetical protein
MTLKRGQIRREAQSISHRYPATMDTTISLSKSQ